MPQGSFTPVSVSRLHKGHLEMDPPQTPHRPPALQQGERCDVSVYRTVRNHCTPHTLGPSLLSALWSSWVCVPAPNSHSPPLLHTARSSSFRRVCVCVCVRVCVWSRTMAFAFIIDVHKTIMRRQSRSTAAETERVVFTHTHTHTPSYNTLLYSQSHNLTCTYRDGNSYTHTHTHTGKLPPRVGPCHCFERR